MVAALKIRGIVIGEASMGDKDKRLTVLTREMGKIPVLAKGAKSAKSRSASCAQLFCCSDFVLDKGKTFYYIREAELLDSFYEIRTRIEAVAYASLMAEMARDFSLDGEDNSKLMDLFLKGLSLCKKERADYRLISLTFMMRLVSDSGFRPELHRCARCLIDYPLGNLCDYPKGNLSDYAQRNPAICAAGNPAICAAGNPAICAVGNPARYAARNPSDCAADEPLSDAVRDVSADVSQGIREGAGQGWFFSAEKGGLLCPACAGGKDFVRPIHPGSVAALQYITDAPLSKVYSFSVTPEIEDELVELVRHYMTLHTGIRPQSLEFVRGLEKAGAAAGEEDRG